MKPFCLTDIHTHHPGRPDALLSLPAGEARPDYPTPFSLQLHPWHLAEGDEAFRNQLDEFRRVAWALRDEPNFCAIGECGLDGQCTVPAARQMEAFRWVLATARDLNLPVIIHCVGRWSEMMAAVREAGTSTNIIHGFRKGPALAKQLLDAGFSISLGEKFNPDVARLIPPDRLFLETDESAVDIATIRAHVMGLRQGMANLV